MSSQRSPGSELERAATNRELPWYVRLNEYESLSGHDVAVEAGITRGEGSDNFSEESAFWLIGTFLFKYLKHRNLSNQAGIVV